MLEGKTEKLTKGKHIAASSKKVQRVRTNKRSSAFYAASGANAHSCAAVRPNVATRRSAAIKVSVAICVAIVIAWGAGLGLASAGGSALMSFSNDNQKSDQPTTETSIDLTKTAALGEVSQRDVSAGVAEIAAEEEAARIAAEEAARRHEAQCIEKAKAAQVKSAANGGIGVYAVDFSIGRDAFIAEWTSRINNYLDGSPLAGYGATFAEAAWENGVDPRWSPAISNTESTKGRNCFSWHNAWGWTGGSWPSWDSAIRAHVKGLAEVYGFTISFSNAQRYCPPNYANWYRDTLNEMAKI